MNFLDKYFDFKLENNCALSELTDEVFGAYINYYFENNDKNIYIVTNTLFEANKLYSIISNFNENVRLFPMDEFITSEALTVSPEFKYIRLETINYALNNKKCIIITSLDGYLRFLPRVETYKNKIINLNVGFSINIKELVSKLVDLGYENTSIVNKTGEFAVRGFIVDIFPIEYDNPIRIEFFDDEIESIRSFSSDNQMSIEKLSNVNVFPVTEFLCDDDNLNDSNLKQKFLPDYEKCVSLYDYLDNPITFYKDYNQMCYSFKNIIKQTKEYNINSDEEFKGKYFNDFDDILPLFKVFYMSLDNYKDNNIDDLIKFNVKTINNFNENVDSINDYIYNSINKNKTVVICVKKNQFRSVIKNLKMKIYETTVNKIYENQVNIIDLRLNSGFIYKDFVVITSNELFKEKIKKTSLKSKYKYSTVIRDLNKLKIGDYIVHNIHGIGIYNGIKTLTFNGILKDYIEILYYGTDKIYIPVEKVDTLYKYSSKEGTIPKINRLGGTEWLKTKSRVRSKVSDMADSLIKLYAERETRKGYSFSKDCDLSEEFESSIDFELTNDQVKAISDIKIDMEKNTPMDRLLCGDVGFGKTEVAFVSAFKAILDSKQVVFLCPTTILSKQHYDNALKRFGGFPVNIALVNRFTTKKEFNKICEGVKDGTIDIVFGTHRLLSDELKFKDLGLLIIDEEQRFGVSHKERIKQIKTNVDVLTLTATPIPRTLQMSLTGIRSLSLIETPPVNRYPIETYVVEENDYLIKDAINKELSRDGQVFILYNRVQSIEEKRDEILKLVPNAKICIIHGQMNKSELETTVEDFINGIYDIMLCTTIIETGIDISNVNTLIVFDADRFGLSQLYQIRGRIGRSDKFAYAYLMYKKHKILNGNAVKRLNAIKEFTELGSGFSIATRDLSIRGAGDILGSEQAGFIDSVGVDLYLKILNEEVNKKTNNIEIEENEDDNNKQLLNVSTHIDDKYVNDDDLKIEIHKKISSIDSKDSFKKVKNELEDRFGKLSDDIIIYMYEEWFEKLVAKIGINKVNQNKNSIEIYLSKEIINKIKIDDLFYDLYKLSNMFRFIKKNNNLIVVLDTIKLDKHPIFYLVDFLTMVYDKYIK